MTSLRFQILAEYVSFHMMYCFSSLNKNLDLSAMIGKLVQRTLSNNQICPCLWVCCTVCSVVIRQFQSAIHYLRGQILELTFEIPNLLIWKILLKSFLRLRNCHCFYMFVFVWWWFGSLVIHCKTPVKHRKYGFIRNINFLQKLGLYSRDGKITWILNKKWSTESGKWEHRIA